MLHSVTRGEVLNEINTILFVNDELENGHCYGILLFEVRERLGIFHEVCV
jgi:hypothetical protein